LGPEIGGLVILSNRAVKLSKTNMATAENGGRSLLCINAYDMYLARKQHLKYTIC
jgi:hypothetical protein